MSNCLMCGAAFQRIRTTHRFCCKKCKDRFNNYHSHKADMLYARYRAEGRPTRTRQKPKYVPVRNQDQNDNGARSE